MQDLKIATVQPIGIIATETRAIYVGKHGSDSNDGTRVDRAFLTIGAAIIAATALSPSSSNPVAIRIHDSGVYAERFVLPDWVSLIGPSASVSSADIGQDICSAGDGCLVRLNTVMVSGANSYGLAKTFGSNGETVFWVNHVVAISTASCAVIRATSGFAHFVSDAWECGFAGLQGINAGSVVLNIGRLILSYNNSKAVRLLGAGAILGRIDSIEEAGTPSGTSAIVGFNGGVISLVCTRIQADTAIDLPVGGILNLTASSVTGTRTLNGTANIQVAGEGGLVNELQVTNGIGVWGATPPASQPVKINDVSGTAGASYTATEQAMLNDIKAKLNAVIDVLEGSGFSSNT